MSQRVENFKEILPEQELITSFSSSCIKQFLNKYWYLESAAI